MTNENLAIVSAIKSFKLEKEIFKTVLKNLIDKDADQNIIALLLSRGGNCNESKQTRKAPL